MDDGNGRRIAVALGDGNSSRGALLWALQNTHIPKGDALHLLHVQTPFHFITTPMGYTISIKQANEEIVNYHKQDQISKTKKLLELYQHICRTHKQVETKVHCKYGNCVEATLVEQISSLGIRMLILGSSSRTPLARILFKNSKIPNFVVKHAADFCSVVVVCKGKLQHAKQSLSLISIPLYQDFSTEREESIFEECQRGEEITSSMDHSAIGGSSFSFVTDHGNSSNFSWKIHVEGSANPTQEDGATMEESTRFMNGGIDFIFDKNFLDTDHDDAFSHVSTVTSFVESSRTCEAMENDPNANDGSNNAVLGMIDFDASSRESSEQSRGHGELMESSNYDRQVEEEREREGERERERESYEQILSYLEEEVTIIDAVELKSSSAKGGERRVPDVEHSSKQEAITTLPRDYTHYSLEEIRVATNSFSEDMKLGEGRFGTVYKGVMQQKLAAIKVLDCNGMLDRQKLECEVRVLSSISHPHVVSLYGVCWERLCLVYEYMLNGSLQDHLYGKERGVQGFPPLGWGIRLCILQEVAEALHFLHRMDLGPDSEPILHLDVRPENILLGHGFRGKLSNTGLVRLLPGVDLQGAFWYSDPEYHRSGRYGPHSDVFALGITALQTLTGLPPKGIAGLVETAVAERRLHEILDFSAGKWPLSVASELAQLALQCIELRSVDRPDLGTTILRKLTQLCTNPNL